MGKKIIIKIKYEDFPVIDKYIQENSEIFNNIKTEKEKIGKLNNIFGNNVINEKTGLMEVEIGYNGVNSYNDGLRLVKKGDETILSYDGKTPVYLVDIFCKSINNSNFEKFGENDFDSFPKYINDIKVSGPSYKREKLNNFSI